MGNLDLECVTSDASGQTLYGLAITYNYSTPARPYSGMYENTVVLVESKLTSTSATHKDLTWSVISAFSTSHLPFFGGSPEASTCAISSSGVFTFLTRKVLTRAPNLEEPPPLGFQYLPGETMDASFGYTGKGAWRNVTVSEGVGWDSSITNKLPRLFYTGAGGTGTGVGTGAGERLMVVVTYNPRYDSSGLRFGVFNPATSSLEAAGSWSWTNYQYGEPRGIAQAGDELYVYGSQGSAVKLTAFSLNNTNTTEPAVLRTYNATSTSEVCWLRTGRFLHTTVYKGTYYLACGVYESEAAARKGGLYSIKDITINTTSFAPKVDISYAQLESNFFVPVSGGTPGATPFAFLQREGVVRSLILGGSQAGVIHDGINLTIAESYGVNPNPTRPSTNNDSDGDGMGAGAIVGLIALLGVVAGTLTFFVRSQKKKNASDKTKTASTAPKPHQVPLGSPLNPQMQKGTFGPDRPNKFRYPLPLPPTPSVPTHALSMAPITPTPAPTTAIQPLTFGPHRPNKFRYPLPLPPTPSVQTHALPMAPITPTPAPTMAIQPQTFQGQMQGLQFSSHPRPNFVTTGVATGYRQEGSSPGAQSSPASAAAWQPTPFVPPPSTSPSDTTVTRTVPASAPVRTSGTTIVTLSADAPPQIPNATRPQAPQFVEQ